MPSKKFMKYIIVLTFIISLMSFLAPSNAFSKETYMNEHLNSYENEQMKMIVSDYLVITTQEIIPVLQPFIEWEQTKGQTLTLISVDYIKDHYDAYDLPAKIRCFIKDAYESLNYTLKNVLLIGNKSDIPMRLISQDKGDGPFYTDYYFAELSNIDEKSWDLDGDTLYGEQEDIIDLTPEIALGRIPFSDPKQVLHVLNNTMSFEQNNDSSYKKHMLLLGAFFWNDTDNAFLMEEIKNNPILAEWSATTLYEQNSVCFSDYPCDYPLKKDTVYTAWVNYASSFVNWAGHGTPVSAHILGNNQSSFISTFDLFRIREARQSVVFANSCNNANPLYPNIALECMKYNVIGFVAPSTISQAASNWHHENDGSSQSFNYFFTQYFLTGEYTLGEAFKHSLIEMNTRDLWYDSDYETCVWGTMYGIPDLSVNAVGLYPSLSIQNISGGDGITFSITNNGDVRSQEIRWNVTIQGGRSIKISFYSGMITSLEMHKLKRIHIPVFGLGLGYFSPQPVIVFTAKQEGVDTAVHSVKASIIGPYVTIL